MTKIEARNFCFGDVFQVYSDLHSLITSSSELTLTIEEIRKVLVPRKPFLILAGDIMKIDHPNFKDLFTYVSEKWSHVFYVLGNHEFYNSTKTYSALLKEYKAFFKRMRNIHLLEKECRFLEFRGVKIQIVGCTLWSHVQSREVFQGIGSAHHILKTKKQNIDIDYYNKRLNRPSVRWLLFEIDKIRLSRKECKPDILIVLTHFPTTSSPKIFKPSFREEGTQTGLILANSNENIDNAIITTLFCGDEDEVDDVKKIFFVSGHTHFSYSYTHLEGRVSYISNQQGNDHETWETRFTS